MKSTLVNGSKTLGVKDPMAGFEKALPQETLDAHAILPSQPEERVATAPLQAAPLPEMKAQKRAVRSQQETGHIINVNNFHTEIVMVTSFGATYNPPTTRLGIPNLLLVEADANLAINKVDEKFGAFKSAVNVRQSEFDDAPALMTRVYGQFIACGTSKKAQADFMTVKRKLVGGRALKVVLNPDDPTQKTVSASQMSYAQRIQHFQGLITTCVENGYTANEADLTIAALEAKKAAMVAANDGMADAYTDVTQARIYRDRVLYAPVTGLVPIALDVKEYVKALFGFNSPEFRMVYHLHFRNLERKY